MKGGQVSGLLSDMRLRVKALRFCGLGYLTLCLSTPGCGFSWAALNSAGIRGIGLEGRSLTPSRLCHSSVSTPLLAGFWAGRLPVCGVRSLRGGGTEGGDVPIDLQRMKVKELQEECRRLGLPVSGRKAQLVERIEAAALNPQPNNFEVAKQQLRRRRAGPTRAREEELWTLGFERIAGVDEAGRGPLAGPVVAAAVILPRNNPPDESHSYIQSLDDSKKLKEEKRGELYEKLTCDPAVIWAVDIKTCEEIDKSNILAVSEDAMVEAIRKLSEQPDYCLIDGGRLPPKLKHEAEPVVKGDGKCLNIAAASIIAKVTRDRIMMEMHEKYPVYNFKVHKGYGTQEHLQAISDHGPCRIHRRTFAPMKHLPASAWTQP